MHQEPRAEEGRLKCEIIVGEIYLGATGLTSCQIEEVVVLTPKLEQVIHTLEWVRVEEFVQSTWNGIGRKPETI